MTDVVRRWYQRLLVRIGLRRPLRRDAADLSDKIYPLW
jgi:hypothetical protein